MKILGIESSCDETAAAIIEDGIKILSTVTATSAGIHALTGGVIPEDAARKQIDAILPVLNLALDESNQKINDIDAIAVAAGPGLIGSLLVGVETAKTLAYLWNKPIIPVNHLVGHIYANWLDTNKLPEFPALALVVSGGHTDLVLMTDHQNMEWIGGTRDDAAGEAFDKTARLLGLPYPGGPTLAKTADQFIVENPNTNLSLFPRPMINDDNFDWSFSGLKTSVLNKINTIYSADKKINLSDYQEVSQSEDVIKQKPLLAAEIQEAVVDSLVEKAFRAIQKHKPKSFLLAGGVAANKRLREKFVSKLASENKSISFHVPEIKLCTDNAAYIAGCAFFHNKPKPWQEVSANPNLTIVTEV